jgi:hypothetical protein
MRNVRDLPLEVQEYGRTVAEAYTAQAGVGKPLSFPNIYSLKGISATEQLKFLFFEAIQRYTPQVLGIFEIASWLPTTEQLKTRNSSISRTVRRCETVLNSTT